MPELGTSTPVHTKSGLFIGRIERLAANRTIEATFVGSDVIHLDSSPHPEPDSVGFQTRRSRSARPMHRCQNDDDGANSMRYVWASATHQGRVRETNEDSLFPANDGDGTGPTTLIVADGMGGHVAGEVASRLAINAAASSSDLSPADRIAAGNRAIREEVSRQPELEGMGTTMTMVELRPDGIAHFAHVGDSRAYMIRDGELVQTTDDHTVIAELMAAGTMSAEEASQHPQRHMITRCLGLTRFVNVDEMKIDVEVGDRILLCSDGLNSMIDDEAIKEGLTGGSAEEAAWKLVDMANNAGGQDNISVIVADVLE